MSASKRMCYLRCAVTSKKLIELPNQKTINIGRSEEIGNSDLFLSKNQLECVANMENCTVQIKPIGKSISGGNGYALVKEKTYTLSNGDRIELRLGFHKCDIVFDPPPDPGSEEQEDVILSPPKKSKIDNPVFTMAGNSRTKNADADSSGNNECWEEIDGRDLLIYTHKDCESKSKIAAFDIDGTIIKTKSGARFPKDADDWTFNFNDIPIQLKELHEDNFKIVFFTNQSGVVRNTSKVKEFKRKIENVINQISLPIQAFIATSKSMYRKPIPGMWSVLTNIKNEGVPINMDGSFFVGDAAGRDKKWAPKRNKDHSMADRLFALNIGLQFFTPEEYFLKAPPAPYLMPEFDPKNSSTSLYPDISYPKQNIILMVGAPCSGKSYYCKIELIPIGYTYINKDAVGSLQKCVKLLEESILNEENVVVDNSNPDKKSREKFIEVAKKYGVDCRCFVMATNVKHSKHNSKFREIIDKSHLPVSDNVIDGFKNIFQEPDASEGFSQIISIPFITKIDNPDHEKLYKMFLLES